MKYSDAFAGVAGDHCRSAGSRQSGHHCALGRSVWSDRTAAGRAHREPVELEGGAGFGGIALPSADGEGGIGDNAVARSSRAACACSRRHRTKGRPLRSVDLRGPVAFIIGSEGAGVPKEVLAQADEMVAIPQSPRVESLNAGIAASILLYEAARQRKALNPFTTEARSARRERIESLGSLSE